MIAHGCGSKHRDLLETMAALGDAEMTYLPVKGMIAVVLSEVS